MLLWICLTRWSKALKVLIYELFDQPNATMAIGGVFPVPPITCFHVNIVAVLKRANLMAEEQMLKCFARSLDFTVLYHVTASSWLQVPRFYWSWCLLTWDCPVGTQPTSLKCELSLSTISGIWSESEWFLCPNVNSQNASSSSIQLDPADFWDPVPFICICAFTMSPHLHFPSLEE